MQTTSLNLCLMLQDIDNDKQQIRIPPASWRSHDLRNPPVTGIPSQIKAKIRITRQHVIQTQREEHGQLCPCLTSAPEGDGWPTSRSISLIVAKKKTRYPFTLGCLGLRVGLDSCEERKSLAPHWSSNPEPSSL